MTTQAVSYGDFADDIQAIKKDLEFIKSHMFDPDCVLTTQEQERVAQAVEELHTGKTVSLSKLKKQLGV